MLNINLKMKGDKFSEFITILKDVSNIDPIVKIKMEGDKTLFYSMKMDGTITTSMKSTIVNTHDIFEIDEKENSKTSSIDPNFNYNLDIVLFDAVRFLKQISFYDTESDIKLAISYAVVSINGSESNHVRLIALNGKANNKTFKVNSVCGELSIIKPINIDFIETRLDASNSEWEFEMNAKDIDDVKKLAAINSANEKAIQLKIENGLVGFSEVGMWDIDVSNIDDKTLDMRILFAKKYLSVINSKIETIKFSKFPTFILVTMEDSKLIMSYEENFE